MFAYTCTCIFHINSLIFKFPSVNIKVNENQFMIFAKLYLEPYEKMDSKCLLRNSFTKSSKFCLNSQTAIWGNLSSQNQTW